jgi:hypothetical protein
MSGIQTGVIILGILIAIFPTWNLSSLRRANQFAHGQMSSYSKYLLGDKRFERAIGKMGQWLASAPGLIDTFLYIEA